MTRSAPTGSELRLCRQAQPTELLGCPVTERCTFPVVSHAERGRSHRLNQAVKVSPAAPPSVSVGATMPAETHRPMEGKRRATVGSLTTEISAPE